MLSRANATDCSLVKAHISECAVLLSTLHTAVAELRALGSGLNAHATYLGKPPNASDTGSNAPHHHHHHERKHMPSISPDAYVVGRVAGAT